MVVRWVDRWVEQKVGLKVAGKAVLTADMLARERVEMRAGMSAVTLVGT